MTVSPDFAKHRPDQTVGYPAAPHNAETNGNGYGNFVGTKTLDTERRRRPPPGSPEEYLQALPALALLNRLPIPMLATGLDGVVVYTNPAFAIMLGYHPDTITLTGQQLSALLDGYSATPPRDCVTALRAASTLVVDWLHAEGFPVRSVIFESVFARATDQILLIGVTDITELMWSNHLESS
ncbi:PAS domain-containing protein [Mycobacterium cookii]|nr:PAS domain-containing protein [Mycobacterium cookii]